MEIFEVKLNRFLQIIWQSRLLKEMSYVLPQLDLF